MAYRPLIESGPRRAAVLAMIMLGVLLLSLVPAYLLVRARQPVPVEVGGLKLNLPKGWTPVNETNPLLPSATVLADPRNPDRHLLITELQTSQAVPPNLLLAQLGKRLAGPGTRRRDGVPLARNNAVAVSLLDLTARTSRGVTEHHLAALTLDGQRYWLLYLTVAPQPRLDPTEFSLNSQFLRRVVVSVTNLPLRDLEQESSEDEEEEPSEDS